MMCVATGQYQCKNKIENFIAVMVSLYCWFWYPKIHTQVLDGLGCNAQRLFIKTFTVCQWKWRRGKERKVWNTFFELLSYNLVNKWRCIELLCYQHHPNIKKTRINHHLSRRLKTFTRSRINYLSFAFVNIYDRERYLTGMHAFEEMEMVFPLKYLI